MCNGLHAETDAGKFILGKYLKDKKINDKKISSEGDDWGWR